MREQQNPLEGRCEDMDCWVHPRSSDSVDAGWIIAFLTSSQVMLTLLVLMGKAQTLRLQNPQLVSHIYPVHHYLMTYSMQEFPYPWEFWKSIGNAALGSPSLKLKCTIKSQRYSVVKNKTQPVSFLWVSTGFPKILANASIFSRTLINISWNNYLFRIHFAKHIGKSYTHVVW